MKNLKRAVLLCAIGAIIFGLYSLTPLGKSNDVTTKDLTTKTDNGSISENIATKVELTVSAAASLKDALEDIKKLYEEEKPNASIVINYGGSGTLQQQIEQGAPVDIFLSAAKSNISKLEEEGLLENNTTKELLQNQLVLVVPKDSKLSIGSFSDLSGSTVKKIAIGEPTTVPAGKYAQQVFTFNKIADAISIKIVNAKDVREVLTWVESGNVEAGVVYATDAKISDKVKVVAIAPEESHDAITYPAAVIKASKHPEAAKNFFNFLSSDAAKAVFIKYGFGVI